MAIDLHAADPRIHDFLTFKGSHAQNETLIAARASDTLEVLTWVTRPSMRHLSALADWLVERRVKNWRLRLLQQGLGARHPQDWDRLTPRLGMALPYVLRAAATARKKGTTAIVEAAPLCLAGPFGSWCIPGHASGSEQRPEPCGSCDAISRCKGGFGDYEERFGTAEFRALRS